MINGVTQLILTKVDVLSGFEEFKVAEYYNINGKTTNQLPFDLLAQEIEVNCKSFQGWEEDIADIKDFEKLPQNTQNYIRRSEEHTSELQSRGQLVCRLL